MYVFGRLHLNLNTTTSHHGYETACGSHGWVFCYLSSTIFLGKILVLNHLGIAFSLSPTLNATSI